jgi:hypothetical protein
MTGDDVLILLMYLGIAYYYTYFHVVPYIRGHYEESLQKENLKHARFFLIAWYSWPLWGFLTPVVFLLMLPFLALFALSLIASENGSLFVKTLKKRWKATSRG